MPHGFRLQPTAKTRLEVTPYQETIMFATLYARLSREIAELSSTVEVCHYRLARRADFTARHEEDILADSLAARLHSFYTGLENIFENIATEVDGGIPPGDSWHKKLLTQMSVGIPHVRDPVITTISQERLEAFRAFRHLFRNLYTHKMNPDRIFLLANELQETWRIVLMDLQNFLNFLLGLDDAGIK